MINMDMMTCKCFYYFVHLYLILVQSCWIDTDRGAIWGFVAPVLVIIIVRLSIVYLYGTYVAISFIHLGQSCISCIFTPCLVQK